MNVYFAGELFSNKDLVGNDVLKERLENAAEPGEFKVELPQDTTTVPSAEAIRNKDFGSLIKSDCAVFHFDGCELDSGTVAEFMFCKAVDMPCVLLRTDFRGGGDGPGGPPWNLMLSHWPRAEQVLLNSIELYRSCRAATALERAVELSDKIAEHLLVALRKAVRSAPLAASLEKMIDIHTWAIDSAGASLIEFLANGQDGKQFIAELCNSKFTKRAALAN